MPMDLDLSSSITQSGERAERARESGPRGLTRNRDVDLWVAALDADASRVQELWSWLSTDERERADRFRFRHDRSRFIVARGMLRHLLARYLGCAPQAVRLRYGPFGKPAVASLDIGSLQFNLAHSQGIGVFGFTYGPAIGVDVEAVTRMVDAELVAARFFAPAERARLNAVPGECRDRAFFECWTRKEAFIKATGDGLTRPLESFEVAFGPGEAPRLLRAGHDADEARRWTLLSFDPGPGFIGAIAVRMIDPVLNWMGDAYRFIDAESAEGRQ